MNKCLKICVLIIFVIFLTGCGRDIKCKNTYNGNIKYKVTIEADVVSGNVIDANAVMKFGNEKDAKEICNLKKLISNEKVKIECAGKIVTISGYEYIEMGENDKTISRNQFIKNLEKQGFKC